VPIYRGGPSDISASVKVYLACKIGGHKPDEPFMARLRERILATGGVAACNTFTKLYLTLFGLYDWCGVPTIPPEVMLLPNWFPITSYETSTCHARSWCRSRSSTRLGRTVSFRQAATSTSSSSAGGTSGACG